MVYHDLLLCTQFNILADTIVSDNTRLPINTHLLTYPLVIYIYIYIYIQNKYTPFNDNRKIRDPSYTDQAQQYLQQNTSKIILLYKHKL